MPSMAERITTFFTEAMEMTPFTVVKAMILSMENMATTPTFSTKATDRIVFLMPMAITQSPLVKALMPVTC